MIPDDQVDAIRQSLANSNIRHDVQVYQDADHGFHCDQRATFNSSAAADAWGRTVALFNEELRS
jgi:carboxymethylenebutenolidase